MRVIIFELGGSYDVISRRHAEKSCFSVICTCLSILSSPADDESRKSDSLVFKTVLA